MFSWIRKERNARAHLFVQNETRGSSLAERADLADSSGIRCKGLLGRKSLEAGEGLWIVPCQSVHCWGMKFPIDVVYLDGKKRVRKLRRAMRPWGISVCWLASSVLELPAGTIDQSQTRRGDQVKITLLTG